MKSKAEFIADMAHSSIGQKRKYTNEPYIVHPRNVAYLVRVVGGTQSMIEAAFLHDVIEDVFPRNEIYSLTFIKKEFGNEIEKLVIELTDISKPEDGNRAARKAIDRKHLSTVSPQAKSIKLADIIDNSLTIIEYDPDFAAYYLREKKLLLEVLKDASLPILWQMANDVLERNIGLLD